MIHVAALPGTPRHQEPIKSIIDNAVDEALCYHECGLDAIMLENMHDRPYLKSEVGPEIVAAMTAVAIAVRHAVPCPLGIQILAGANQEALAVAMSAGLDFIRAEGFVFGHLADEGYIDSCAGRLLRYRKQIGADHIAVYTDIKKKHASHQITADIDLEDTIHAAEFFLSDGIIVTGTATGVEPDIEDVIKASKTTCLPLLLGSGIHSGNIERFWPYADAFIVGSDFKSKGRWELEVDRSRVIKFMDKIRILRLTKQDQ